MRSEAILWSHARDVRPNVQRCRERGLLAAAALGETHLHVSSLRGEVLALGAFHRELFSQSESASAVTWRRHTGGRAIASGDGFLVTTLALPHRSALAADDRFALKPEQVMNRCVRGLLAALRRLGLDPVYPGLDLVTAARHTIAHLSFVEAEDGATLFQAILAVRESFAGTPLLLDRLDPDGAVATTFVAAEETTTLAAELPSSTAEKLSPAELSTLLASGYSETFGLDPTELDPEVTEVLATGYESEPDPIHLPSPPSPQHCARIVGKLGPIEAWVRSRETTIESAGITGDFIAPQSLVERLDQTLHGRSATGEDIRAAVESLIDGQESYVLGLDRASLVDLLVSASEMEP